jgi:hypothetical protein
LMAGPLQVPKPVGPGIRSHHERWDGRGYPDGLSGEEIPVQARIIAIAEVFNAYTSGRAYRDPKALSDALQIIQSESGKAFDPRVVDALGQALRGESAQFGCVSVGKPFLPRCFEQKGTPAELCARCPAYHSTQPCWSVAGVLCDRHGDRKCETCFIYTEAKWRSQLVGAPFADVRPIARTATGERDA